jgi:hypothetical protein
MGKGLSFAIHPKDKLIEKIRNKIREGKVPGSTLFIKIF